MTDVRLINTPDNGDLEVTYSQNYFYIAMDAGLETAVYLSLFGGKNWWGNLGEQPENQATAETEAFLATIPATTGNLRRLEQVVLRDLSWIDASVEVSVSIPKLNWVQIDIDIGEEPTIRFIEAWLYDGTNYTTSQ